MNYSMISESAALPIEVSDWYASFTARGGVSHDTANRIYPHAPPAELIRGIEETLVYNSVLAEADQQAALMSMIGQAVVFMLGDSGHVLTGHSSLFSMMHNTPQHRIWCARYEDNQAQYGADFNIVFGYAQTNETLAQASEMIKQYFIGL